VKDLLTGVGAGGGAAAAAPAAGGAAAAAGGDAAPAEAKAEEKAEGRNHWPDFSGRSKVLTAAQRRKSQTRTWVSVSSIRGQPQGRESCVDEQQLLHSIWVHGRMDGGCEMYLADITESKSLWPVCRPSFSGRRETASISFASFRCASPKQDALDQQTGTWIKDSMDCSNIGRSL